MAESKEELKSLLMKVKEEREKAGLKLIHPGEGNGNPLPVFLPGKVKGQRSLAGYSPWDYKTEHARMRVEGDGLVATNW